MEGKDSYSASPHLWRWGLSADHVLGSLLALGDTSHVPPFPQGAKGRCVSCACPPPLARFPLGDLELPQEDPWPGLWTETLSWAEPEKARPPRARPFAGARACSVLSIRVCTGHRPFAEGQPHSVHAWTALSFSQGRA